MTHQLPPSLQDAAPRIDPVVREVAKGALSSLQLEMELLLERTSMSPFIREKKDYFFGIFDAEGALVMGTNIPVFGDMVQPIFAHFPKAEMRAGDIYWYADCYGTAGATSHTPDQVFVAPVLVDGQVVAFVQSWAHFQDVGGMRPGSLSPDATDIFQEGIIVPPVRLYREGVMNEDAFRIFQRNSRYPEMILGDTRAAVAAVRLGERRMLELMARFGAPAMAATFRSLIDETRRIVRARMREAFPPGRYEVCEHVDEDGHGNGPFALRFVLHSDGERFVLDTTGSDDQAPGPINYLTHPNVLNMIFGLYFTAGHRDVLLNDGASDLLDEVRLRPGSILLPISPAPLGQRGVTLIRMISACTALIGQATRGNAVAASNVYGLYYMRGRNHDGTQYLITDGVGVGCGARPFADGIDAVYLVAQENYPAEFMDQTFPVRLLRYALNCDSGGPGRWRGGAGVVRDVELLAPTGMVSNRAGGIDFPPWGIRGGMGGGVSRFIVNPGTPDERVLPSMSDGTMLKAGDILRIETGGGGGWGDPFEREPERVREDVRGGIVSRHSAERDYGVILHGPDLEVDEAATARLRRSRPPAAGLFHRRGYMETLT